VCRPASSHPYCAPIAGLLVTYFTDPACPRSWAAEPVLRSLLVRFGDAVEIDYVMAGLYRNLGDPQVQLRAMLDALAGSDMPGDARLWLDRPPRSTYPAGQAVKAAAEQGLDGPYLRVLREAIMVGRRAMDAPAALVDAAAGLDALDAARFEIDLHSAATIESFGADLERARSTPPATWEVDAGRVRLPTFRVGDDRYVGPQDVVQAVLDAGVELSPAPSPPELLRRFDRIAAAEVAACCDLPLGRAQAELWQLAAQWRARPERFPGGELWSVA
jgi:predicted DsbA family dithiol-disulfide isomerase